MFPRFVEFAEMFGAGWGCVVRCTFYGRGKSGAALNRWSSVFASNVQRATRSALGRFADRAAVCEGIVDGREELEQFSGQPSQAAEQEQAAAVVEQARIGGGAREHDVDVLLGDHDDQRKQ